MFSRLGREWEYSLAAPETALAAIRDLAFLGLVVLLSLVLYVGELGFYSDDWIFLNLLDQAPDQSLAGLSQALYAGDLVIRQRPVQVVLLAGLWRLFGLQPLGYHLANGLVLLADAGLFYGVLRKLQQPRFLALSLPLLYVLLPHYSTGRFWVAAFQAPLSISLYLASLYAGLQAVERPARPAVAGGWLALSLAGLVLSGLAYEVAIPLFLLNPILIWLRSRQLARLVLINGILTLLGLGLVLAYKAQVTVRLNLEAGLLDHLINLARGAIWVSFGTYGAGLPLVVAWILRHRPDGPTLALAALTGGLAGGYLYGILRSRAGGLPGRRYWAGLVAAGLVVFAAGYAVFVANGDVWFTSASLGNRIAVAAALGVAMVFAGAAGWVSTWLPARQAQAALFCTLVAGLAGTGFLITNTLAQFWGQAYDRQQAILSELRHTLPAPPPESTLILDGECLEQGGAYVFTGGRDLAGLVGLLYQDRSLWATAIIERPEVTPEGVTVHTYRKESFYPFGPKLFAYHIPTATAYPLDDFRAAQHYFQESGFDPEQDCGPGFAWGGNE